MRELVQININLAEGTERLAVTTGCTEDDLRKRFLDCVTIFNANTDSTIGGYLDQYVTVQSVHKGDLISGIVDVEAYFADQFEDNPHFNPGQEGQTYRVNVSGSQGQVWGLGKWRDDNNTHGEDEPVKFNFIFVCKGGSWLLSSAVAKR